MNSLTTVESIVCLDMIETIINMVPEETEGELIVIIDCIKLYNLLTLPWKKTKMYVIDALATALRAKQ